MSAAFAVTMPVRNALAVTAVAVTAAIASFCIVAPKRCRRDPRPNPQTLVAGQPECCHRHATVAVIAVRTEARGRGAMPQSSKRTGSNPFQNGLLRNIEPFRPYRHGRSIALVMP